MKFEWYRVLQHFEKEHYIVNGLTLPFLCGINTELHQDSKPKSIIEFINEVISNKTEFSISILKCPSLKEFVFGILDTHSLKVYKMNLSKGQEIYSKIENFYITDGSMQSVSNLDGLISLLCDEYGDTISNRKFSKIEGKWKSYSEIDKKRIHEIKQTSENNASGLKTF